MGKRGPRPQPTNLKLLEGVVNQRRINFNEPKPKIMKRTPKPPGFLGTVAKAEWRRIAGELFRLGLLTNLDITALGAYCQCYSTWLEANENIKKHGVLVKAQSGFPVQSPYVSISNRAMVEMRRWLAEFGMTPSSRTRTKGPPGDIDPDITGLLT